jgi:hypothetical protein
MANGDADLSQVADTGLQSSDAPGVQNNVWDTISSGASSLAGSSGLSATIGALRDVAVARTRATPSGVTGATVINPFPGTQSPYPQNDAKNLSASVPGLGALSLSLPVLAVIGLVIFLLLRRGR